MSETTRRYPRTSSEAFAIDRAPAIELVHRDHFWWLSPLLNIALATAIGIGLAFAIAYNI